MIAKLKRTTVRRSPARRRLFPIVETFEPRLLLTVGAFLQGTAFLDANADGTLGTNDLYLPGATIQLFRASDLNHAIASTTSDAKGQYRFDDSNVSGGLAPGNYKLVETPPSGFTNSGAQALSQLNPATVPAGSKNAILVTIADPSQDKVTFDSTTFFNLNHYDVLFASVAGVTPTVDTSTGQLPVVVGGTLPTSQFLTYCVDLGHQLANGTNVYSVIPRHADALPGNGGAIAYLYNHYGTTPIASTTQAVGLQLAIWQLEYGNALTVAPDLTYTSAAELAAAHVYAASYVAEATGKSETAIYLDANVAGVTPLQDGMQGVIATGSLNFGNVPLGSISGTKFLDKTGNGFSPDDTPLGGVTINLYVNRDGTGAPDSANYLASKTTDATTGSYKFDNLAPGQYFVQEAVPTGSVQTGGAPNGSFYVVNVASGTTSTGNNFDDFKTCDCHDEITSVSFTLVGPTCTTTVNSLGGKTHQGDQVTVNFTVAGNSPVTVTLVSYVAPTGTFDNSNLRGQTIFSVDTETLSPGQHSLTVTLPNSYYQIDFVCGQAIDHFGPTGSNIFYHAQGRYIDSDQSGTEAPPAQFASLSGSVNADSNGLGGVTVKLSGTDANGKSVSLTRITAGDGSYHFLGLQPGNYSVSEVQPSGYVTLKNAVGTVNNHADGTLATPTTDVITAIKLSAGDIGVNYNFSDTKSSIAHKSKGCDYGNWGQGGDDRGAGYGGYCG